ncbi:hypothetical protein WN944_008299 [Citrus x changshan-huyou]|uniref:O-methyltransferase dimerisation domain-containing protein n=1 Tax=Citrus x changshan-huyou TaxID=2935761 RepID=A0AAP0MSQ9_9ROSI
MSKFEDEEEQELGKLAIRFANAAVLPMVLKSALELNVIDTIFASSGSSEGAFLSHAEIASRLPAKNHDAPVLPDRMLRLLAGYDILKCKEYGRDMFASLTKGGAIFMKSVTMHIVLKQDVLLLAQSPVGKERSYKDFEALAVMSGIFNFEIVCRAYNS